MPDAARPRGPFALAARYGSAVKWVSLAVILLSLLIVFSRLQLDLLVEQLKTWIQGLGAWGPIAYILIYIIAVLLMAPGVVLTLLGGAMFGLWRGTAVVMVGANIGAALAFLIARYLARERIARRIGRWPKFKAVDHAISEGGWKIVAMLRLSPVIPFNVQNYMYGLTGVRFWTCVVTSILTMLPGTFMYVYIGHITGAALGGRGERTVWEWLALGVGLATTIAATVYVTRMAKKKLEARTAGRHDDNEDDEDDDTSDAEASGARTPRPTGAIVTAAAALVFATVATIALVDVDLLYEAVGAPPPVTLRESYAPDPGGPKVDHGRFDALLEAHVDADGWIDYDALRRDAGVLDAYLASLAQVDFDALGRDEKLALLINAYNAATLRLILDHYPIASILDIPEEQRWDDRRWRIAGQVWSLNDIEHKQIRPHFFEARIHFALVCAAVGCPPLRRQAYTGAALEEQLTAQSLYVHTHDRWYRFEAGEEAPIVHLTSLYKWYGGDFRQVGGSVLQFVVSQPGVRELAPLLDEQSDRPRPRVQWIEYDWSLNDVKNRR